MAATHDCPLLLHAQAHATGESPLVATTTTHARHAACHHERVGRLHGGLDAWAAHTSRHHRINFNRIHRINLGSGVHHAKRAWQFKPLRARSAGCHTRRLVSPASTVPVIVTRCCACGDPREACCAVYREPRRVQASARDESLAACRHCLLRPQPRKQPCRTQRSSHRCRWRCSCTFTSPWQSHSSL